MLVEGRLEPAIAQHAAVQPLRGQRVHLGDHRPRVDVGRAEQLQRAGRAAPLRQGGPLQHHRAGVCARHRQVGGVRTGIDPRPLQQRPAEARPLFGPPPLHGDHAVVDVQLEAVDEPQAQLAQGQAVTHRHGSGADKALPARPQRQPLDRPPGRVGPVQHPHRLAVLGRRLQHIQKRGHEGVDAAPEVLQVHQQHVERAHPLPARPPHLAIQAEHRNAVHRISVVRALHHIVLQVALHPVLGTEERGQGDLRTGGQRIHRMRQVLGHRGRMRQQRHAPPLQLGPQRGIGQQAIKAEVHRRSSTKESGW